MRPTATDHVPLIDDVPRLLLLLEHVESAHRDGPTPALEPSLRLAATGFEALLEPLRGGLPPGTLFDGIRPALALRIIDAAVALRDQVESGPGPELASIVADARAALTSALDEAADESEPAAGVTVDLTSDPTVDLTGALGRAEQLARRAEHQESASITELCGWIGALLGDDDLGGLAPLVGVSARTLRRWSTGEARPRADNADRLRAVARAAGHLRRRLDPAAARAWFEEPCLELDGATPLEVLDDPARHGALLAAAARVATADEVVPA